MAVRHVHPSNSSTAGVLFVAALATHVVFGDPSKRRLAFKEVLHTPVGPGSAVSGTASAAGSGAREREEHA